MPAYKDKERNTWYCKFYYEDWTGTRKQKKKRGFKTQREAKAWEKQFLDTEAYSPDTTLNNLLSDYYDYAKHKNAPSTLYRKKQTFERHIIPTFGDVPINQITTKKLALWQNELMCKTAVLGNKSLSPRTVSVISAYFETVMNYAVKYYDLPKNPFTTLDKVSFTNKEMKFWEIAEFQKAIEYSHNEQMHIILQLLFYGGFRIGEISALTKADMLDNNMCININKTYKEVEKKWIVGPPKSRNSIRVVPIPKFVWEELQQYVSKLYGITDTDYIFTMSRHSIRYNFYKIAERANVQKIRIHDLRHSHVSYLINLGFSTFEIADRIGDTPLVVEKTYAHLYQSRRQKIAQKLQLEHQNSFDSTKIVP